jgi:hypothetical protein
MRPIRRLSRVPRAALPALASVFLSSVLPSAAADAAAALVLHRAPAPAAPGGLEPEVLDHRYPPASWQTCIGLPDDPFKTIVGSDGGLYYDYGKSGPANYSLGAGRFGTRLLVSLVAAGPNGPVRQILHAPRVPVVTTVARCGALEMRQVAWAAAPAGATVDEWSSGRADHLWVTVTNAGAAPAAARLRLEAGATVSLRLDGARNRILAGDGRTLCSFSKPFLPPAVPPGPTNVASRHALSLNRNWAKPAMPCADSFRHVFVAYREPIEIDVACEPGRRYVVAFGLVEAWHKEPGKRPLEIRIEGKLVRAVDPVASQGPNVPAALLFPAWDEDGDGRLSFSVGTAADAKDRNAVLSGLWVFPAAAAPDAGKVLSGEAAAGAVAIVDADHVPGMPKPLTLEWDLGEIAPGRAEDLFVTLPQGVAAQKAVGAVDPSVSLREAVARWEAAPLPYGRVEVADPAVQGLLDSCVRNIWQAREIKDGLPAFQVGPTTYRGLWVVDGAFILEAAALLGRADEARRGIDYLMSFQKPDGGFMLIDGHWKETGIVLWAVTRHARLTGDKAWLAAMWPKVERGFEYIRGLRARASAEPGSPAAGLIPTGFSDGGLSGPEHEYTNIHWTMVGLRAAADAARWLGRAEQAVAWSREYEDFVAAFRRAAARDLRDDGRGNRYLPIVMNAPADLLPQKAQWAFLHAVHPGGVFAAGDPIVRGNMAMLAACEREGLVLDTGWLSEGLWNYFGSFYGHAWLWLGHGPKAASTLYAFGNHASPMLCWREEQRPVGEKPGYVGDMPHNWASAEFIRLAVHLMILERGDELHLLEGMPRAWCRPGAVNRLAGIPTAFGPVDLDVRVAGDGRVATVAFTPPAREPASRVVLHLESFGRAAESVRVNGAPVAGDPIALPPGRVATVTVALRPEP